MTHAGTIRASTPRRAHPRPAGRADRERSGTGRARRSRQLARHEAQAPAPERGGLRSAAVTTEARRSYSGAAPGRPWQSLYFLPEPQGQGSLRPGAFEVVAVAEPCRRLAPAPLVSVPPSSRGPL